MPSSADLTAHDPWHRLDRYRSNITSQSGEDGIIDHLLTILPDTPKICLEVGAGDGLTLSNTNTLWSKKGWRALLIESDSAGVNLIRKRTADNSNVTAVQATIEVAGPNSLDKIAERANFPARIGVLSLDIDANDLEIFENLLYLTPDIIIIEFNHEISSDTDYRDLPDDVFFRHSAKAVETSARERGYRIVGCAGPNAILVRLDLITSDIANSFPDLPVEAMFDYAFLRSRRARYRLVESKFTTQEVAVQGKPSTNLARLVRIMSVFRRLRQVLQGKPLGTSITPKRRENLRRAGLWI
jgi:hypothetical protein